MNKKPKLQTEIELTIAKLREFFLTASPEKQQQALKEFLELEAQASNPKIKQLFTDLHLWLKNLIEQEANK